MLLISVQEVSQQLADAARDAISCASSGSSAAAAIAHNSRMRRMWSSAFTDRNFMTQRLRVKWVVYGLRRRNRCRRRSATLGEPRQRQNPAPGELRGEITSQLAKLKYRLGRKSREGSR